MSSSLLYVAGFILAVGLGVKAVPKAEVINDQSNGQQRQIKEQPKKKDGRGEKAIDNGDPDALDKVNPNQKDDGQKNEKGNGTEQMKHGKDQSCSNTPRRRYNVQVLSVSNPCFIRG